MARTWPYSVCRIRVLLIGLPGISVYIVSWTRTFEAIMPMSHKHQPAQAVQIFHQAVPSLMLNTIGIMHRVHRAFKAFDDPDQNLAQFIESRIFHRCVQFLVSWPRSVELKLSARLAKHSKTLILQGCWILSPSEYSDFSQITTS
jgi:hypothetical protein